MPITSTFYPFQIDHKSVRVFDGKDHAHWRDAAECHGYSFLGRAFDRLHVALQCNSCGSATLKRISVLLGHNPECGHCIQKRRETAASRIGAQLLGVDPDGNRHYGLYQFECGHRDRRQHTRVEAAAAGGHKLSCTTCTHDRHAAEAEAIGWTLSGPAERIDPGYRKYTHSCGHEQDVAVANMRFADVNCAGCSETWTSKPSAIYLLSFALPDINVVKLGFSNRPAFRLEQVQIQPSETRGTLDREIKIDTGHRAICLEKALHSFIKRERPDLIVPQAQFADHIRTTSEIYHEHGRVYITSLLDAVDAGWDPNNPEDWVKFARS